jgi:hypothetical protein
MRLRRGSATFAGGLAALALLALSSAAMAQQKVTGAIFTTNYDSSFVNGNVYDFPDDVYLNGGPRPNAPCTSAGLPDGDYYFQVTDPSGKVLLSYDNLDDQSMIDIAERKVTVSGGLIRSYSGIRFKGTGKCANSITVELFPYLRTPNPGGEYKVWMTHVDLYDRSQLQGSFGFIPSSSKTDNFKVSDYDGDGTPDSEDNCPDDPFNNCGGNGSGDPQDPI